MFRFLSILAGSILTALVVGCSGLSTDLHRIKVDPMPIPEEQQRFEDSTAKAAYLAAVKEARSVGHNCGHYRVDDNGSYILDRNGSKITDYDDNESDWVPAVDPDPLRWNDKLYTAAYEHNIDMLSMGEYLSHDGTGGITDRTALINHPGVGSTYQERVLANGYKYALIRENIVAGTDIDTPEAAIQKWLGSAGHCRNLMDPDVIDMGMSHVYDEESIYKHYWTLELAKPAAD